jgi:hypothetical protein
MVSEDHQVFENVAFIFKFYKKKQIKMIFYAKNEEENKPDSRIFRYPIQDSR